MLTAKFEILLNDYYTNTILDTIALENEVDAEDDDRLDHLADFFRKAHYLDLWVYRGGHHIALHFQDIRGNPHQDRAVLIS